MGLDFSFKSFANLLEPIKANCNSLINSDFSNRCPSLCCSEFPSHKFTYTIAQFETSGLVVFPDLKFVSHYSISEAAR